ncbi:Vacuolar import and degradation protein 27 [Fusarium oxysporum f. sp. rapae]|uniref:Vacuolar import and degradation protein 27 n=1 Tax=Fusarium oxysporum f. sp. rapae TaxID=485398 RepID=A0A8J5NTA0_FUSOX|nr:Vacuolar import and degradation protein 27 [Fusarium oxysporum f. sp. rapae]
MLALRTFSSLILGHGARETLSQLSSGQLHLLPPLSNKGYSQLIFRESDIRVLPASQRFPCQLIVRGVFEEGGAQLLAEEESEVISENGEKTFLLDESLIFDFEIRESGDKVIIWKDAMSRPGNIFQFVCDSSIALEQVQEFVRVARECLCEHRHRNTASQSEVEQADLTSFIGPRERHTQGLHFGSADDMLDESATSYTKKQEPVAVSEVEGFETEVPQVCTHVRGELHLFVPQRCHFALVDDSVFAKVSDIGKGKCWLRIEARDRLAAGYKHDRSFVVRGSKIGVFRHLPDNAIEFATNISKVQTIAGKLMKPTKVLLHSEDRHLILQHEIQPNKLHCMDLERGKVIDEWKIHDDDPVVAFAPETKFAQMSSRQTFLGISNNSLYRVDPRLPGNKVVNSERQQYVSRTNFSALATTEKGYIAVASHKGDMRLFDRLGIRAKTQLPSLGDPITAIDVTANGRWILCTTKNYLLLIDAQQKSGQNESKLGFEKSFPANDKPQPRRLALTPEHVAQYHREASKPIEFTPAKFNTDQQAEETSIITATGPYLIEWNLKRILQGSTITYKMKRCVEDVKAKEFKHGSDKAVLVALSNGVDMTTVRSRRISTRERFLWDSGEASSGISCLGHGRDRSMEDWLLGGHLS